MTGPRSRNTDGHAVADGGDRYRTPHHEQLTGAFDLLATQIEALRNEIDYLKEQVAQLQETKRQERTPARQERNQTNGGSSN